MWFGPNPFTHVIEVYFYCTGQMSEIEPRRLWLNSRHGPAWIVNIWWRHQMETFSVLLTLCAGNSPVTGEFPSQRPVTLSFDVFFDLRLNKSLSKQSWGWWFETRSRSLWRHCNDNWKANRNCTMCISHGMYSIWVVKYVQRTDLCIFLLVFRCSDYTSRFSS